MKNETRITNTTYIRNVLYHLYKYPELSNALVFLMLYPKYVYGLEIYCDDIYNELYPLLPSYYRLTDSVKSNDIHIHLIIQYYKPKNKEREV